MRELDGLAHDRQPRPARARRRRGAGAGRRRRHLRRRAARARPPAGGAQHRRRDPRPRPRAPPEGRGAGERGTRRASSPSASVCGPARRSTTRCSPTSRTALPLQVEERYVNPTGRARLPAQRLHPHHAASVPDARRRRCSAPSTPCGRCCRNGASAACCGSRPASLPAHQAPHLLAGAGRERRRPLSSRFALRARRELSAEVTPCPTPPPGRASARPARPDAQLPQLAHRGRRCACS